MIVHVNDVGPDRAEFTQLLGREQRLRSASSGRAAFDRRGDHLELEVGPLLQTFVESDEERAEARSRQNRAREHRGDSHRCASGLLAFRHGGPR